jgi:hypothetical protein
MRAGGGWNYDIISSCQALFAAHPLEAYLTRVAIRAQYSNVAVKQN